MGEDRRFDWPMGVLLVTTQVVTYQLDDSTKVRFEVEPVEGFRPAGAGQIAGRVRDAVEPAVDAAKAVLDKVNEVRPDEVEVSFGIKVSGGADWFVARTAGEAGFEVKLTWARRAESATATSEAASAAGSVVEVERSGRAAAAGQRRRRPDGAGVGRR